MSGILLPHRLILVSLTVVAGLACVASAADVTSTWLGGYGSWTVDANWDSLYYPNNDGTTYEAVIDSAGAGDYTVTLDGNVSVDRLVINSPEAELHQVNETLHSVLTVPEILIQSGMYCLETGRIAGATISGNGQFLVSNRSDKAYLDGVTLNADAVVGPTTGRQDEGLRVVNGLELNGTITMPSDAWEYGRINFEGDQTLSGTGEIVFAGTGGVQRYAGDVSPYQGTLTIGSGITIRTGNRSSDIGNPGGSIINQGLISAETHGAFIAISGDSITNDGTIRATNSELAMDLTGTWINNGQILIDNSDLRLTGTYTMDSVPNMQMNNARVYLQGTLDNTGRTLTIDQTDNHWVFQGRVVGGTLATAAGSQIDYLDDAEFEGVTLATDLTMTGDRDAVFSGGLTLDDSTVIIRDQDTTLFCEGPLAGTGQVVLEGDSSTYVSTSYSDMTIESGITVRTGNGSGGMVMWNGHGLTNFGTVLAGTPGESIRINCANGGLTRNAGSMIARNGGTLEVLDLVNEGTIDIDPGSVARLYLSGANTGTINLHDGSLELGGEFTLDDLSGLHRNGGDITFSGTLLNEGRALSLDAFQGPVAWQGTIVGGQVDPGEDQKVLEVSEEPFKLDHVTLNADLNASSTILDVSNSLVLNKTITLSDSKIRPLATGSNCSLSGAGEIVLNSSSGSSGIDTQLLYASKQFIIGPDITIRTGTGGGSIGSSYRYAGIVNQGTISSQTPGQTIAIDDKTVVNEGLMEADNGGTLTISAGQGFTNPGELAVRRWSRMMVSKLTGTLGALTLESGGIADIDGVYSNQQARILGEGVELSLRGTWSNEAFITATSGSTLGLFGQWTNNSEIAANDATLNLGGTPSAIGMVSVTNGRLNVVGRIDTPSLQSIAVSGSVVAVGPGGTLVNDGSVFDLDSYPVPLNLDGGSIVNGTVVSGGVTPLLVVGSGSFLDGVSLQAPMVVYDQASVTARDASIQSDVSVNRGGHLVLDGAWDIQGSVSAHGAEIDILTLADSLGALELHDSRLNLYASGTTDQLLAAGYASSALHVCDGSVLDNSSNSIPTDPASAQLFLSGGTVLGGSVDAVPGGIVVADTGNGSLENVAINSDLVVQAPASLTINGGSIAGNTEDYGTLQLTGGAANAGAIHSDDGRVNLLGDFANSGSVLVQKGTLGFGPSASATLGNVCIDSGVVEVMADCTSSALAQITNNGASISIVNGAVLDNTGRTLDLSSATPLTIRKGTLRGGTVASVDGTPLQMDQPSDHLAVIDAVTLACDLEVHPFQYCVVHNGLTLSESQISLAGTISLEGAQAIQGNGQILFTGWNAHIYAQDLTIGNGIELRTGSYSGRVYASGSMITNEGTITSDADAISMLLSCQSITNTGAMVAMNGGRIDVYAENGTTNDGRLVVSSGSTIGINGEFLQTASGSLGVELGQDNGVLSVSDTATLGGELLLSRAENYKFQIGDVFQLLVAGSIDQSFSAIDLSMLPDAVSFDVQYELTTLRLEVLTAPELLAGDIAYDGFVGQGDLDVILDHWGNAVPSGNWAMGDISGDGFVGQADLDIVLNGWGDGMLSSGMTHIPEPTVLLLLTLGSLAVSRRKR